MIELIEVFRIEEKLKLYMVFDFCVISLQQLLDSADDDVPKSPLVKARTRSSKRMPEFQVSEGGGRSVTPVKTLFVRNFLNRNAILSTL